MYRGSLLVLTIVVVLSLLIACAPAAPTAAPAAPTVAAKPPASAATTAATAAPTATPRPGESPVATTAKVKRGGVLRLAVTNDWETLDPHLTNGNTDAFTYIFSPLARIERDGAGAKLNIVPDLAISWDQVDPKTLVLKLRQGVKFQDGSLWNAEVAKFNLDRMMKHPKSVSKDSVKSIDSVDVVDNYTVRLNLKSPSASVMILLAPGLKYDTMMIPKDAAEKMGDDFGRKPVGAGPFQVAEWRPSDQLILKKWDGYWEKGVNGQPLPYLDGAVTRYIVDDSVRLVELKAHNIDAIFNIAGKDIPSLKTNPDIVYTELGSGGLSYSAALNPAYGPFKDNVKLRQAAWYGLNRQAIADTLGRGAGKPAYYLWTAGLPGYDETLPRYDFQPDKAKQLVAESGHPNGADLLLTHVARPLDAQQAQIYKQMWDAIGIRTTIDAIERVAWVKKGQTGTLEATTFQLNHYQDVDYYSRGITTGGAGNWIGWSDPDMDKCMADGRATFDPAQRQQAYRRCMQTLYEKAVYQAVWFVPWNFAIDKSVKGVVFNWYSLEPRFLWLDR
ncbi:MAG: ABC transporter substrate-binding protein [Bacteroidetes bacterium]|nr:ABC transporter substrate-binding protein [Bacteroidota bacterium]MCL5027344.1 ABC transporter substrate-binding protein [Chloroflexota bacterium]